MLSYYSIKQQNFQQYALEGADESYSENQNKPVVYFYAGLKKFFE